MKAQPLFYVAFALLLSFMIACTRATPAPSPKVDNWTEEEVMKKIEGEWKLVRVPNPRYLDAGLFVAL